MARAPCGHAWMRDGCADAPHGVRSNCLRGRRAEDEVLRCAVQRIRHRRGDVRQWSGGRDCPNATVVRASGRDRGPLRAVEHRRRATSVACLADAEASGLARLTGQDLRIERVSTTHSAEIMQSPLLLLVVTNICMMPHGRLACHACVCSACRGGSRGWRRVVRWLCYERRYNGALFLLGTVG